MTVRFYVKVTNHRGKLHLLDGPYWPRARAVTQRAALLPTLPPDFRVKIVEDYPPPVLIQLWKAGRA